MSQQYSETIKHHYHHPLNTGKLSNYTHSAEQLNPLCGDEIKVYLDVKDNRIRDIRYEARGCMISIAAASVLSEFVKGKTLQEAKYRQTPWRKNFQIPRVLQNTCTKHR